jgi:transposase
VAALFGVSHTLVKKLLRQRRETGSLAPKPHGGGHRPQLDGRKSEAVRASIVEVKGDASLAEVQSYVERRLKVAVSQATVSRLLQRLGLPRKKTLVASERAEERRAVFRRQGASLDPMRLIFAAELAPI